MPPQKGVISVPKDALTVQFFLRSVPAVPVPPFYHDYYDFGWAFLKMQGQMR